MSKSAKIRQLYLDTNMTVKQIANQVGVRYQFAYNVVRIIADKRGEEVRKSPVKFGEARQAAAINQNINELKQKHQTSNIDRKTPTPAKDIHPLTPGDKNPLEIATLLTMGFSVDEIATTLEVNRTLVQDVHLLLQTRNKNCREKAGAS